MATNNDRLRGEFEAWAAKRDRGLDLERMSSGTYSDYATHQAWRAWQASRAELVVELPAEYPESYNSRHMMMDSSSVIEAIEAAGVMVKP